MKIIQRLIAPALFLLVATLGLVIAPAVAPPESPLAPVAAQAYATQIFICNSGNSDDWIQAYRTSSPFQEWLIGPGQCSAVNDAGGDARVDVDPSGGSADIDSWEKRHNPDPYGPCYAGENGASNPYSGNEATTTYQTSKYANCIQ